MSDPDAQSLATWIALAVKATQVVSNNQNFLTNAANATFPLTNAEQQALVNQTMALTRQVNVLIRVTFGELDTTDGT